MIDVFIASQTGVVKNILVVENGEKRTNGNPMLIIGFPFLMKG